jgi:hypothetical protein
VGVPPGAFGTGVLIWMTVPEVQPATINTSMMASGKRMDIIFFTLTS